MYVVLYIFQSSAVSIANFGPQAFCLTPLSQTNHSGVHLELDLDHPRVSEFSCFGPIAKQTKCTSPKHPKYSNSDGNSPQVHEKVTLQGANVLWHYDRLRSRARARYWCKYKTSQVFICNTFTRSLWIVNEVSNTNTKCKKLRRLNTVWIDNMKIYSKTEEGDLVLWYRLQRTFSSYNSDNKSRQDYYSR